jgi:23S rRNA (adenine2503-C2)-methyltransferase
MAPPIPLHLTGLTVEELETFLGSRARALAAAKWIYGGSLAREVPERIEGVAWERWQALTRAHPLPKVTVRERRTTPDGTTKLLVGLDDVAVETVLIPARGRSTVCVSSQSGCTRHCAFCATATLGFRRQLSAGEILAQFLLARESAPEGAPVTNVVFMGMGEPLDNLDQVLRASRVMTQMPAPRLGNEQVTVSTSGVLPGMKRFLRESKVSLALSLNATTDAQRDALMPHNKTWPIAELMQALRDEAQVHPDRQHFIEYVLFDGVNDSDEDAARLAELLRGIPVRINLIPHNPMGADGLSAPKDARLLEFQQRMRDAGYLCFVRWPRGREIAAACGQLALNAGERTVQAG